MHQMNKPIRTDYSMDDGSSMISVVGNELGKIAVTVLRVPAFDVLPAAYRARGHV